MKFKSKLKLDLSLVMIGLNGRKNVLNSITRQASRFKDLGNLLRTRRGNSTRINPHLNREEVSLDFENGTLDVELIKNLNTDEETINGFDVT